MYNSLWYNCSILKSSKISLKKIHQKKTNAISKNKTDHQKVYRKAYHKRLFQVKLAIAYILSY